MTEWHVCDMDDYRAGPFASKRDAVQWCILSCLDGRKRPKINRVVSGFYEYHAPSDPEAVRQETFYLFREKEGVARGFDAHLADRPPS